MAYDLTYGGGLSRSLSRRPSMGYAVSAPAAYGHGGYIDSGLDVGTSHCFTRHQAYFTFTLKVRSKFLPNVCSSFDE